jgi:hypothetical protein
VTTVHVDATIHLPLDGGGTLPLRQGMAALPTSTPGLVVFPALVGILAVDDSTWHVTHVATGRRIPVSFADKDTAEGYANALGGLGDWTQGKPAVPPLDVLRLAREHGGTLDARYAQMDLNAKPRTEA